MILFRKGIYVTTLHLFGCGLWSNKCRVKVTLIIFLPIAYQAIVELVMFTKGQVEWMHNQILTHRPGLLW